MAELDSGSGNPSWPAELATIESSLDDGPFLQTLTSDESAQSLVAQFVAHLVQTQGIDSTTDAIDNTTASPTLTQTPQDAQEQKKALRLGLAVLGAFLQANVTGPVLEGSDSSDEVFVSAYKRTSHGNGTLDGLRGLCLRSLDTDGVSVYPYIPSIQLFCLARYILASGLVLPVEVSDDTQDAPLNRSLASSLSWTRLRIHLWHYKLLTQPSLGPGSLFTKSGRWTDVSSLQDLIETNLKLAEESVMHSSPAPTSNSPWTSKSRVQFALEKANCHLMLGNDAMARKAIKSATDESGFTYALSGALGKRTKFQEKSTSQLVVIAKSRDSSVSGSTDAATGSHNSQPQQHGPAALDLNDDTLLEKISFEDKQNLGPVSTLPDQLQSIAPEDQPQLEPEDQMILLTDATIRDTFSPADSLTSEEILPFAVRVIEDKVTNWQIYTQALLVRSRIELNRSRTLERAVLQMQAVVDQVIVDTQEIASKPEEHTGSQSNNDHAASQDVPAIAITSSSDHTTEIKPASKPTSFLPAAKPTESASPQERIRYVNALASPPRWHLESELAYSWAAVGSLVSALEIFKRLRLWPEVALCFASSAATSDEDGRGSGGEEKARAIVRWRLFHRTDGSADDHLEDASFDISTLKAADFQGSERSPPPPNAPRLLCILGDIEQNAEHYERAWEISNKRFARAQKSLAELSLRQQKWAEAREAYHLAVGVNRHSNELWSRLGDIELRLGNFPDATVAFQRAIAASDGESGGEDARTWSNLGSALLSWYREVAQESKVLKERQRNDEPENLEDLKSLQRAAALGRPANKLLNEALSAFKRGATVASTNWRIWENVVTLAASLTPLPSLDDMILGMRNVIRIRATEDALDLEMLTLLLREVTSNKPPTAAADGADGTDGAGNDDAGVYTPPRGTVESNAVLLFEDHVAPLITARAEAWSLVSRLRAWRRDWAGALDAAEKAWRAEMGGSAGSGSALSAASAEAGSTAGNWQTDPQAWDSVVQRTEELVAAYENYVGGDRWRGKARSAVRSVLGKARESWEGDARYAALAEVLEGLK